jgi:hypothetical protein
MTLNAVLLKGRIKERYPDRGTFAKAMGWSRSEENQKINMMDLELEEITRVAKLLEIPKNQITSYFFTPVIREEVAV